MIKIIVAYLYFIKTYEENCEKINSIQQNFYYKYNQFELLNLFNISYGNCLFNILLNVCFARFVNFVLQIYYSIFFLYLSLN